MKIKDTLAMLATAASLTVSAPVVQAQAVAAPKELPPGNFTGRQYVDSAGCAFIRAGAGGVVQWVPRVTRNRRLVCGLQPSLAAGTPAPQTRARAPAPEVLVLSPAPTPAPVVNRPGVPNRAAGVVRSDTAAVGTVVTPANAASKGVTQSTRVVPRHVYEVQRKSMPVTVPEGYRSVWKDDRLNPRRAEQTLGGHQRMQKIWTRTTPRRLSD